MRRWTVVWLALSLLALPLLSSPARAQDPNDAATTNQEPATKLGRFFARKGVLAQEDSKLIAQVDGKGYSKLFITAVSAYDPRNPAERIKGFRLYFFDKREDKGLVPDEYTAYVDAEEAQNLMKSLQYMAETGEQWKGKKVGDKTIRFIGTDAYQFYLFNDSDDKSQIFVSYAGILNRVRFTFKGADGCIKTRAIIEQGLKWLDQPGG